MQRGHKIKIKSIIINRISIIISVFCICLYIKPAVYAQEAKEPAKKQKAKTQSEVKPTEPKSEATSSILDPDDPLSIIYLDTKGNRAGTGDPAKSGSPSVAQRIGSGWHPAAMASEKLPKDKYGLVNWAKLVYDNRLKPRHSPDPAEEESPIIDMDILIETKSDFIDNVIYPHYIHTWWLPCEVCHPNIFLPARGENNMFMTEIAEGKWCGRCHGKVSFPLTDCTRCHVSPKEPQKASK